MRNLSRLDVLTTTATSIAWVTPGTPVWKFAPTSGENSDAT